MTPGAPAAGVGVLLFIMPLIQLRTEHGRMKVDLGLPSKAAKSEPEASLSGSEPQGPTGWIAPAAEGRTTSSSPKLQNPEGVSPAKRGPF